MTPPPAGGGAQLMMPLLVPVFLLLVHLDAALSISPSLRTSTGSIGGFDKNWFASHERAGRDVFRTAIDGGERKGYIDAFFSLVSLSLRSPLLVCSLSLFLLIVFLILSPLPSPNSHRHGERAAYQRSQASTSGAVGELYQPAYGFDRVCSGARVLGRGVLPPSNQVRVIR